MSTSICKSLLAASLVLSVPSLRAQGAADPSGHWEGSINAPFGQVAIEVDLAKNSKGGLAGTFSNPKQSLRGFPLASVAVEDKYVSMLLRVSSGGGTFDGALAADGKTLSGEFITAEGGYRVPFSLTRMGDPRIEPPSKSPPIGKELEGVWSGTLDADGKKERLVLIMSNQPDGTATGSLADIDQGLEIPIANLTQKASNLTFEIKAIGASYSGSLNAENTELSGTFTEGTFVQSMTFVRSAVPEAKIEAKK